MARVSRRTTTARRGAGGRKTVRSRSVSASSILERPLRNFDFRKLNGPEYKKIVRQVSNRPVLLSLAGTVGAFFLGRLAYRYYQNHPEISEFIRDNIDTVEEKIREFRSGSMDEEMARH